MKENRRVWSIRESTKAMVKSEIEIERERESTFLSFYNKDVYTDSRIEVRKLDKNVVGS